MDDAYLPEPLRWMEFRQALDGLLGPELARKAGHHVGLHGRSYRKKDS